MRNKLKKLPLLLSLLAILLFTSGSYIKSIAMSKGPDYSGNWEFFFYDDAGKLQGRKVLSISNDGSISGKVILNLDYIVYNTEVSGSVTPNGKVNDGSLTDTDKLEMVGVLTGSFTENEGNGKWKNYYGKSGTWKATWAKQSKRE